MRCPECDSDNVVTDENKSKICSDCGLVIDYECRLEAGHSLMQNNSAIGSISQNGSSIGAGYAHVDSINRIRKVQQYIAREQCRSQHGLYQIRTLKHALEIPLAESIMVDEYKSVLRIAKGIKANSKHLASVIFYIILKRSKMNFNLNDLLMNANLTRQKFFKLLQQILALDPKLRLDIIGEETLLYYNDAELIRAQEQFGFSSKMMGMVRKTLSEEKFSPIPRINAAVGLLLTLQKFRKMGIPIPEGMSVVKLSRFMQVAPSTIYSNIKKAIKEIKPIKAAIDCRDTRIMPRANPVAVAIREELAPTKIHIPSIIPLTVARATSKISPQFVNLVTSIKTEIAAAFTVDVGKAKIPRARSMRRFTLSLDEKIPNIRLSFDSQRRGMSNSWLQNSNPPSISYRRLNQTQSAGAVYRKLSGQRALGLAEKGRGHQPTFSEWLASQRALGSSELPKG
jgi:transposase-like protein